MYIHYIVCLLARSVLFQRQRNGAFFTVVVMVRSSTVAQGMRNWRSDAEWSGAWPKLRMLLLLWWNAPVAYTRSITTRLLSTAIIRSRAQHLSRRTFQPPLSITTATLVCALWPRGSTARGR